MVIGEAGTTVALAGGGIPGMAIPIGGGTDIIGGAGYPAGAPSLIRIDPATIGNSEEDSTYLFIFYERLISTPLKACLCHIHPDPTFKCHSIDHRHQSTFQTAPPYIAILQLSGLLYLHRTYSHIPMILSAGLPFFHLD